MFLDRRAYSKNTQSLIFIPSIEKLPLNVVTEQENNIKEN